MDTGPGGTRCHLYINSPDHVFDAGLVAEAEQVAGDLTRKGFPIGVEVRYARGDAQVQREQIESDRRRARGPGLFIVIPVDQNAMQELVSEVLRADGDATIVLLHQSLTRIMRVERQRYGGRLFSVSADQEEIGRIQARQFAALLPNAEGSVLYVQGREDSHATRHRLKGVLDELNRAPGVRLAGYRVFGDWSPGSVRPAIDEWERLGGKIKWIGAAGAQSDDMALAMAQLFRDRKLPIPVTGVDGLREGKDAVDRGVLEATVVQPLAVGHALEIFRDVRSGVPEGDRIPEDGNVLLPPVSYPPVESLKPNPHAPRPGGTTRVRAVDAG
jgi:ABC-type sugar transport system substrate-binding protein